MPKLTAIRKQTLNEMMKASVFEATVSILSEFGIVGMTMDRVAAKAGMAKGNLYRYFENKQALLEFVYSKLVNPLLSDLEELSKSNCSAIEKLNAEVGILLKHVAVHSHVYKLLFYDDAIHMLVEPMERQLTEASHERLTRVFRQGIAEGSVKPLDPHMLASIFMYVGRGVLECQPKLEDEEQQENIRRLIMDTLLSGIGAER